MQICCNAVTSLTNFNILTGSVDPHPTTEGHNLILQAHVNVK